MKKPNSIRLKKGRNAKIASHPEVIRTKIKPGEVRNPKGRPKGSRNKFAEEFVADFLSDWEKHGRDAIKRARRTDPVAYLKVAASLLPKDFNINVSSEAELEKMLEQFDDEQLEAIFAAISAASASSSKDNTKAQAREKPGSVH